MSILEIIEELNLENGTKYKESVLVKHKNNELFKRVLKMTYDKVIYTYGVTMKNIVYEFENNYLEEDEYSLEMALDELENNFCTRKITGNEALDRIKLLLETLKTEEAIVFEKVIDRDLKINLGKTLINKVFKELIVKPCYMRCGIFSLDSMKNGKLVKGTARDIKFKAFTQKKADGTFREFIIENNDVKCNSRSGETYEYPLLFNTLEKFKDNMYAGELTVYLDDLLLERILPAIIKEDIKNDTKLAEDIKTKYELAKSKKEKYILPRSIGNGLINSDDVPHENLILELWECVSLEEYRIAALKDKKQLCTTRYEDRYNNLVNILDEFNDNQNIRLIEGEIVDSLDEAVALTSKWMQMGYEGSILKDFDGVFKDGTSKHQLKLKIAFDIDARIVAFIEGTPGTKREETFGSIVYETDDKMIQGSVSGFTDEQLKEYNSKREQMIGMIITLEGNDLTQGRGNNYYAVSHPRFIELRNDKDYTDTLERAFESLELAKMFKERE